MSACAKNVVVGLLNAAGLLNAVVAVELLKAAAVAAGLLKAVAAELLKAAAAGLLNVAVAAELLNGAVELLKGGAGK